MSPVIPPVTLVSILREHRAMRRYYTDQCGQGPGQLHTVTQLAHRLATDFLSGGSGPPPDSVWWDLLASTGIKSYVDPAAWLAIADAMLALAATPLGPAGPTHDSQPSDPTDQPPKGDQS